MYDEIEGDLFDIRWNAIGHGCNILGVMGAGVAAGVHRRYPQLYQAYRAMCMSGQFRLGDVWPYYCVPENRVIYNLATQPTLGPTADLGAIRKSVQSMLSHARGRDIETVALPRIGSGLGGLEWGKVRDVLQAVADPSPVRLIVVALAETKEDPRGTARKHGRRAA